MIRKKTTRVEVAVNEDEESFMLLFFSIDFFSGLNVVALFDFVRLSIDETKNHSYHTKVLTCSTTLDVT